MMRVPFSLMGGFKKETPKYEGEKRYYQGLGYPVGLLENLWCASSNAKL